MILELKPELEALIQERLASGAFASPEEVIERALRLLAAEEDWLAEHREEIAAAIEDGWQAAERGELNDPETVRANLARAKQDWTKRQGRR